MDLTVGSAPNMNLRHPVSIRGHAEGQVAAARRPGIIANLIAGRVDDLRHLAIGQSHDKDLSVLVAKSDPFAVRRPFWLITHRVAAAGNLLRRFRTILWNQIELFFAAEVRDEGDL